MGAIVLSAENASRVRLLARAWNVSESDAIGRLLDDFETSGPPVAETGPGAADHSQIAIHSEYEGQRIEARYNTTTAAVQILTGRLAGKSFKSPSGAASAVVRSLNPRIRPNRNGWSFWTISQNGPILQTVRRSNA